jgi:hypothetical protein
MSLWTPDGEIPVEREQPDPQPDSPDPGREVDPDEVNPEQAREMAEAMAQSRKEILETSVGSLLANHAMGMYELAAIHLTAEEPDFAETRLAIDALKILIEGLQGRLGEVEETLVEALHQIQLGYVQRYNDAKNAAAGEGPPPS